MLVLTHDLRLRLRLRLPRVDRLVVLDDGTVSDDVVIGAGYQSPGSPPLIRLLEAEGVELEDLSVPR